MEGGSFRHSDLDLGRRVVERQVGEIGAQPRSEPGDGVGRLDAAGARDFDPFPFPLVEGVEIDSADAGGGHVGHGQIGSADGVADLDRGRVGVEAEAEPGAVAGEAPHGRPHGLLRLGGEAVVAGREVGGGPALTLHAPGGDIVPDDGGRGFLFLLGGEGKDGEEGAAKQATADGNGAVLHRSRQWSRSRGVVNPRKRRACVPLGSKTLSRTVGEMVPRLGFEPRTN